MPRTRYATPEDVVRRALSGTLGRRGQMTVASALDNNAVLETQDDRETLTARLEAVESRWDRDATPMRSVRVGSEAAPEYFDAKGSPWPVNVYLDHMNIAPFDANMGDFIETRTGRDAYTDITSLEGQAWVPDYNDGIIAVYRRPGAGQLPAFRRIRDRFIKISYRIGAGGDFASAGETTLAESITDSDSDTGAVDVTHASRLPRSGETMLIGGSEYVYVSETDHDNDTITIDSRGVRYTEAAQHDSGTVVHFCPLDVRDAIAGLAAAEVWRTEDITEAAYDGDLDRGSKIENLTDEYLGAVGRYSTQSGAE